MLLQAMYANRTRKSAGNSRAPHAQHQKFKATPLDTMRWSAHQVCVKAWQLARSDSRVLGTKSQGLEKHAAWGTSRESMREQDTSRCVQAHLTAALSADSARPAAASPGSGALCASLVYSEGGGVRLVGSLRALRREPTIRAFTMTHKHNETRPTESA
jgi:hypothetical protein